MESYLRAVDLIDSCIQDLIKSLENPRTALEVFDMLKNIQKAIHPKMEEVRVWEAVYMVFRNVERRSELKRRPQIVVNIHPKNKPWVFEYLRQLSCNKTVL
jgi:hypothetical protein